MTRAIVLVLALSAVAAQRGQAPHYVCDEHSPKSLCPDGPDKNIDEKETRIPPGDYCKRADLPIAKTETRAHPCDCTYTCKVHVGADGKPLLDVNGHPQVEERGGEKQEICQSYCEKNGRQCSCHPEPVCDLVQGEARLDMHHRMTAIARAR